MSLNRTKQHGIHLNVIYIVEISLFSAINIFVFTYNLCKDISNDVSVYLSNCGSVVGTASDSVCYGSIFKLYAGKNRDFIKKQHFICSVLYYSSSYQSDIVFLSSIPCIFQLNWRHYQ